VRFRRILVGVDLASAGDRVTFGSARAVEQALRLARPSGAEIVFVHSTWADMHEEIRPSGPVRARKEPRAGGTRRGGGRELRARALELVRERAWLELIRRSSAARAIS
jgi:nucleotide-binding universal stress UspA family protein